jgi:serine/threonine-protein kinase
VLHRDLKPANVLIAADGHSKLTDFGIATSETLTELTAAGMVIGTPAYLAPERIEGEPATVRSDLYSVGVMCYEALTGTRPFRGDSPIAVAYAARHSRLESVRHRRDDVPRELDAAVMRAIARRPEDRFGTAEDFAAALANQSIVSTDDATVPNMPVTATRVLPVHSQPDDAPRHNIGVPALAILAAAIVLLALGAFALRPHGSSAPASRTPVTAPRPLPPSLQLPFDTLQHLVQR